MRKASIKKIGALVLSATLLVSATITSHAATCSCGGDNGVEISREVTERYFESTDYHRLTWTITMRCNDCYGIYYDWEYQYEEHSYQWNDSGLTCIVCGDTYSP